MKSADGLNRDLIKTGTQKQLDELTYWNAVKLETNKQAAAMTDLISQKYQSITEQLSGPEKTNM